MKNNIKLAFFGTSNFSVICLNEIKQLGFLPSLIITTPDKPVGRKLILQPNPVKTWAIQNNIAFLTPVKLNSEFISHLTPDTYDLFLVASYGKIIPKTVLDLPKRGTLNIHPSLLPKYRGPSPLQTQILDAEKNIGITLMLMDEQVDHGPLITQEKITLENILNFNDLEKRLAQAGASLLIKILPDWLDKKIEPHTQDHTRATFTKKVEKTDGELDIINSDPYKNYLKFLAYYNWPGVYFFLEKDGKKIRVLIKDAEYQPGQFIIKRVLPEGKKEMSYNDFLRGIK